MGGALYSDKESLRQALKDGSTILVKGSWLQEHNDNSTEMLPRRQGLPAKAAWDSDFVDQVPTWTFYNSTHLGEDIPLKPVMGVGVSYCWERKDHPDPRRELLKVLARMARLR